MRSTEDKAKATLRKSLLARRRGMSRHEVLSKSDIIAERVLHSWEYQQARAVLLYCSFDNEVETGEIIAATLRHGKRVILPKVNRDRPELDLFFVEDIAAQVGPGIWGLQEPIPELCEPTALADVDCVIAPGIGFDMNGGRLGFGGGYYDRLLNSLSPDQARVAVGLCYELQIVREVPRGFFDASVSIICTEVNLIDNR